MSRPITAYVELTNRPFATNAVSFRVPRRSPGFRVGKGKRNGARCAGHRLPGEDGTLAAHLGGNTGAVSARHWQVSGGARDCTVTPPVVSSMPPVGERLLGDKGGYLLKHLSL